MALCALENHAKNNPGAAYDLDLRSYCGDGVPQDNYKALEWKRTAAEGGDVTAQAALGRLYSTGLKEMGSDLRESDKWLFASVGRGDEPSRELMPWV